MKLWLDDVRPAPKGWEWAKTAAEAIELLEQADDLMLPIEAVSLDHDLGADPRDGIYARGASKHCGCEVVHWIVNNQPNIVVSIRVHSWNGYEAKKMVDMLRLGGYARAHYEPFSITAGHFDL